MAEKQKMTTPVPAVGAAGEQSNGLKSNDIIPKETPIFNKRKGSLTTVSCRTTIHLGQCKEKSRRIWLFRL